MWPFKKKPKGREAHYYIQKSDSGYWHVYKRDGWSVRAFDTREEATDYAFQLEEERESGEHNRYYI